MIPEMCNFVNKDCLTTIAEDQKDNINGDSKNSYKEKNKRKSILQSKTAMHIASIQFNSHLHIEF